MNLIIREAETHDAKAYASPFKPRDANQWAVETSIYVD